MKKKIKYFKGFTLVEVLIVMGIFIILTALGLNSFVSTEETFTAKENVELIIQDIESTKLKAMNMESSKDATWIYGFGIDFTAADEANEEGDYIFFKWCSPVGEYGDVLPVSETNYSLTGGVLPNLYSPNDVNQILTFPVSFCDNNNVSNYKNGGIVSCYFASEECTPFQSGLVKVKGTQTTLLNREVGQMEILDNDDDGIAPAFILFESLTGRAIIYNRPEEGNKFGSVENYLGDTTFNKNDMVPLDIVLYRKRSDKFNLVTVYPVSGEVINHVYDINENLSDDSICEPNKLSCIKVRDKTYERHGIREEINSSRDVDD